MSGRTALIIGGGVVGVIVLYELFRTGGPLSTPSTRTTVQSGNIVSGLISPIASLLSNLSTPAGPQPTGLAASGQSATPVYGMGWSYNGETLNAGSAADTAQISAGSED